MSSQAFTYPAPPTSFTVLSFPAPHLLVVTLSRPAALNCINTAGHAELASVWDWLDKEPSLRVGIITGLGRAFCAGADLKEWNTSNKTLSRRPLPPSGFGGLSTRTGKKPIIAAINGICFGGGCEMAINTDIVLASSSATFALTEVKRGVVAIAGALPRLVRTVGKQRASEMALTGRILRAEEAREWGFVNKVVADGKFGEGKGGVVGEAVRWGVEIAANSPDSVVVGKMGVGFGWEVGASEGTERLRREGYEKMDGGENMIEGVRAFVEKRKPRWVDSKL